MPPTRTATVALDAAAAAVVRGARQRGERVNVTGANGRRLGVLVSVADIEAIENAQDALDADRAMMEFLASGEAAIPWSVVRAELGL